MDRRRWNRQSNLEDESVESSSQWRKSQEEEEEEEEEEDLLFLLRNNNNNITAEEEEEDGSDWSQVLEVILELITARLHIGDRIQSSRVCKHWRSIVVRSSHPTSYGSPCLLRILDDQRETRFMLTDHFHNEHYIMDTPSLPPGTLIAHSNNGWLLLVKHCIGSLAIFLFNPLTQVTVELPKLPRDRVWTFGFWSNPTSSSSDQCRVIAKPPTAFGSNSTSFFSWVSGAKEWEFLAIDHQEESNFEAANHKPFLIHDQIYLLDSRGRRLGIYNLSDQKLTVIGGELPIQVVPSHSVYYNFVKMDDKVIFVYTEEDRKRRRRSRRRIHLYELDESKQQLVKLKGTRGRSLFFCKGNCIFAELPTSGSGADEESAWDFAYKNEIVMSRACVMNKPQTVRTFKDDFQIVDRPWTNACWIDLNWS